MYRRCARCWQKTSDVPLKEKCRELGSRRELAAAGLCPGRHCAACLPIQIQPVGRCCFASTSAGTVIAATAVRLPPHVPAGEAGGCFGELEEALPYLQGRALDGPKTWWAQTGSRHESVDGHSAGSKPDMVIRLRVGRVGRRTPLPHPVSDRRLQPGVPGDDLRRTCRS